MESVPENVVYPLAETSKKAGKSRKNSDGKAAGKFICKTICQYSKEPVSDEDMKKLMEIADGYGRVKNYVYSRYSGIASLSKLYPGYTVQNEMTKSGLRSSMGLPSVYFYLAIFDALGDIKSQWTRTKNKVLGLIGKNEGFSEEEKHYLRFVLRVGNAFEAVMNQQLIRLPAALEKKYQELAEQVDEDKLQRYLCRQVRKYHVRLHTEENLGFSAAERAYRYENHGIYLAVKEKRKRVFVPLTDNHAYLCQIYVKLYPQEKRVVLHVPVKMAVKAREDFVHPVGIALGMYTMLTTDGGNSYGEELGDYQIRYAEWMQEQTRCYNQNRENNPGRKKYTAKKQRLTEQMHSYINHELNRFLEMEKPKTVYMAKLPKPRGGGMNRKNRKINYSVSMWQRGYIRSRLEQKCRERGVEIRDVWGKDIGNMCSYCGEMGKKKDGEFVCESCGFSIEEKVNTARNVLKRGMEGKRVTGDGNEI